jgi:hypothetical protein
MTEPTLKEKIESAGKGSDELSAHVLCDLLAPKGSKVERSPYNGAWCIYEPRTYGRTPTALWEKGPRGRDAEVTTSLDAALALVKRVLPGCFVEGRMCPPSEDRLSCLEIYRPGNWHFLGQGQGATPALALLSALLTALKDKDHV